MSRRYWRTPSCWRSQRNTARPRLRCAPILPSPYLRTPMYTRSVAFCLPSTTKVTYSVSFSLYLCVCVYLSHFLSSFRSLFLSLSFSLPLFLSLFVKQFSLHASYVHVCLFCAILMIDQISGYAPDGLVSTGIPSLNRDLRVRYPDGNLVYTRIRSVRLTYLPPYPVCRDSRLLNKQSNTPSFVPPIQSDIGIAQTPCRC